MSTLICSPIGFLKSSNILKFDVPRQPSSQDYRQHDLIELTAGYNFEAALRDLKGFNRIWLIWWFHRNSSWRPCVMPPRGKSRRRGVFATRSPHRPNPIGISAVELLEIRGRKILISPSDLVDGTPILDIKPYITDFDSFPDASRGWLDEIDHTYSENGKFSVNILAPADQQLKWLKENWEIDFFTAAQKILSIDPGPHRTRRITRLKDGSNRIGCGAWRMLFNTESSAVNIFRISPGYPLKSLLDSKMTEIADREAQLAFYRTFGE